MEERLVEGLFECCQRYVSVINLVMFLFIQGLAVAPFSLARSHEGSGCRDQEEFAQSTAHVFEVIYGTADGGLRIFCV